MMTLFFATFTEHQLDIKQLSSCVELVFTYNREVVSSQILIKIF